MAKDRPNRFLEEFCFSADDREIRSIGFVRRASIKEIKVAECIVLGLAKNQAYVPVVHYFVVGIDHSKKRHRLSGNFDYSDEAKAHIFTLLK